MLTIRGIYDGEKIIPLETFEMSDNVDVTITFASDEMPHQKHYVTEKEFLEMTNEDTHWELRYGELIKHSPQRIYHSRLSTELTIKLYNFVIQKEIGEIHTAPTAIKFTQDLIYEPDIFFLTTEQADGLELDDVYFVGVPKLVVEIVSSSSRRRDTQIKFADYEHFGVEEYWVLDPLKKEYRFYHLEGEYYQSIPVENDTFRSVVLKGFEMDLRKMMVDLGCNASIE